MLDLDGELTPIQLALTVTNEYLQRWKLTHHATCRHIPHHILGFAAPYLEPGLQVGDVISAEVELLLYPKSESVGG